ncbi:MAG: alpha/beta fold hydrolase [Actinobacteria bacterium]|nr:alpha/beta fold hydrolase [Actinomycetota bacterium]
MNEIDPGGRLVDIGDTALYVVERGMGHPLICLHGGPGLDHTEFGDYLDPLGDALRLILVDQRAQGRSADAGPSTWSLEQMAADVSLLAGAMGFEDYSVLGHSFGAFVALQHACDHPGAAASSIISSGLPSFRYLAKVDENLANFEPIELREQVTKSWADEQLAETSDDIARLMHDQMPFHFKDPYDPRIAESEAKSSHAVYSPAVLKHFSLENYGSVELEDRLGGVPQPVLVLAGRHDRTCDIAGAEAMARGIRGATLVVFEESAHMTFVEENAKYLDVVRSFLTDG